MSEEIVRQRCVLVLPSTAEFDSRTYRLARTLHDRGHDVTVVARWRPELPRRETHDAGYAIVRIEATAADSVPRPILFLARIVERPLRALRIANLARRSQNFFVIRSHRLGALRVAPAADLYHGMAFMGIPVALALGRRHGGRVVYDARDIYMVAARLARVRGPIKWLLARLERGWAQKADRVVTVNEPYADELQRRLRVERPVVVMNCSYRFAPPERARRFHDRLGLAPGTRVVLYQGGFSAGRGVEQLMEAILDVPDAVLVVMGYGDLEDEFKAAAALPRRSGRVFVLPAVPPTELLEWVASADVVGVLFQHDTLNNYLSTPNKFLEAMAAGVPSVCSDHPGMAPIARATGCGIPVSPDDVPAVAAALRRIVDAPPAERETMRQAALRAAHETYNWESQVETLLDEYTRLTGRRW